MPKQSTVLYAGAVLVSALLLLGCPTRSAMPTDSRLLDGATDAYRAYERGDCDGVWRWADREVIASAEAGEIRHSLLLIQGFCHELAGSLSAAMETYRGLVRDAPLSFASDDARERLRILRLTESGPDYRQWVEAARDRASSATSGRVPLDRILADFPPLAERAGIEGYAVVEFGVTPRGDTFAPIVVDSRPPLLFDGVALRAVREWRYERDLHGSESERQAIRIVFLPVTGEASSPAQEPGGEPSGGGSTIQ